MNAELNILDFIQTLRTPFLDKIMIVITSLGNAGIFWIIMALLLLIIPKTRKEGFMMGAALLFDLLICNLLLKPLAARIRPCDVNTAIQLLIKHPTDYSFPSGHTSASFAAAAALFFAESRKLALPSILLAAMIAFSRLYLYVHYPTDVLGGIIVGVLCGWLGLLLTRYILRKYGDVKVQK